MNAAAASACPAPTSSALIRPRRRPATSSVRLTERGIALILITGVLVAVAALTVVSATAARVTSDRYQVVAVSGR